MRQNSCTSAKKQSKKSLSVETSKTTTLRHKCYRNVMIRLLVILTENDQMCAIINN